MSVSLSRILVVNDDGIHAPGLKLLSDIASTLSDDVWVVAPETEQSASSHSLTVHDPIRLKKYDEKRYSVTGTPTDCVLMATNIVMPKDQQPTLVLSGINRGANVGDDIGYSGTVAGAMEACLVGLPAIALSQLFGGTEDLYWGTAKHFAPEIIRKLCAAGWPTGTLMNVNFPACHPDEVGSVRVRPQGKHEIAVALHEHHDPKGNPYYWLGGPRQHSSAVDTDVHALDNGYVTITPLHLDMTDYAVLKEMEKEF